ncbi:helix-turn-helix transcriptional regulator [Gandjariella thermophila]|uniref:Transcriptional regulator n=1 Tax=Gandjariella thermophila TaxID=1931992 RepID=A0A4D4JAS3_9PSEU|nr:transcriptional regulator [Gandjariella thermophila]GDY33761.1 transcriptional regulator [Gandjariella thermophila]
MTADPDRCRPAIAAVAVLHDDVRRGLYEFIRRSRRAVTREEAAGAAGISRKLAAFHLDKLVDAGLLVAHTAPGRERRVGRRPKVYQPAATDIRVTIPERRPDMLAEMLLDAVLTEDAGEDARQAAFRVARSRGRAMGEAERAQARPGRLGPERALTLTQGLLEGHGFEPSRDTATCVRLHNCPFHPLAARAPDLVCGLNRELLAGFLDGLQAGTVEAVLVPRPGQCCVELRATPAAGNGGRDTPG